MPRKYILHIFSLFLIALGIGAAFLHAEDEAGTIDESVLKKAGLGTSEAELIAFLRKQTVPDRERRQIEELIHQLADPQVDARDDATDKLLALGVPAVPFLREASRSPHREVAKRAGQCLAEIKGGPDVGVLGAAIRCLVRRHPPESVAVLLEFFPFCGEDWVEDEVLVGLGTLGIKAGKPEATLQAALQDPLPARRAAAVGAIARWGDVGQRTAVRKLLNDPEVKVRNFAGRGLLGDRFQRFDLPAPAEDRQTVITNGINPDAAGLVAFFKSRTLSEEERRRLEKLVRDLDDNGYLVRKDAAKKLIEIGNPALAFLRPALTGQSLNMTRLAEDCIREIEKGPGPVLPMAALRLLARRHPPEAVQVLLDYLPFADDSMVEEEVVNALSQLAITETKVPEKLRAALKSNVSECRADAALVLGMVGDKDDVAAIKPLLEDEQARVRLRAAQGLLTTNDRTAIPVLLALLGEGPLPEAAEAEGFLRQIGGAKSPLQSVSDGGADGRKQGHEAWVKWWRDNGDNLEVTGNLRDRPSLGLTLVAELGGGGRRGGGGQSHRVWEFGRDDKVRFELTDPINPIDAHVLPGNRLLVAEYTGQKVTERDLNTKQVVWEHATNSIVVSCQRLANGNTFIATYNTGLMEVTPAGKEVYNFNPAVNAGGAVFNAIKLKNGQIACITANGQLIETDTAGKVLRQTVLDNNGGWNGLEELPGNRLLIALQQQGKVVELDSNRKSVWEAPAPGAVHALRLNTGRTLIACGNLQKLIEVDRDGKQTWEKATTGRPFHVRRR